ncbi:hypothetical protein [Olleya sp. Bg11-27]|uniref:hypothetical protein n=1 Tax=Olleya sp. Bg11-27 TaxID=2058135 RepID=UPI000C312D56|nr:hypothetical protein [Olleya sp. Bg11-27]AUC75933.1 hypothetical protein CW732_09770 [Olleya sp. Bg11-27]
MLSVEDGWLNKTSKQVVQRDNDSNTGESNDDRVRSFFLKRLTNNTDKDCRSTGRFYGLDGKKLQRLYRDYLSDLKDWNKNKNTKQNLLFLENIGRHLSLDEIALSKGELYTIITNKKEKGKKRSIVAILSGTKKEPIIEQLVKL